MTRQPPTLQGTARAVFSGSAWFFAAGVLLQVYFAGLSILVDPDYIGWHFIFAHVLELVMLVLLVAGLAGRVGRGALLGVVLLFGLFALQYALVNGSDGLPRGLHAVNAFALFWVASRLARDPTHAPWNDVRSGRFLSRSATGLVVALTVVALLMFIEAPGQDDAEARGPDAATEFSSPTEAREVGREVYAQRCAGCHGDEGDGGIGPGLVNAGAVADTETLVRQILEGGGGMPAFAGRLSAREVAGVATHVRSAWNNDHPAVEVATVEALR